MGWFDSGAPNPLPLEILRTLGPIHVSRLGRGAGVSAVTPAASRPLPTPPSLHPSHPRGTPHLCKNRGWWGRSPIAVWSYREHQLGSTGAPQVPAVRLALSGGLRGWRQTTRWSKNARDGQGTGDTPQKHLPTVGVGVRLETPLSQGRGQSRLHELVHCSASRVELALPSRNASETPDPVHCLTVSLWCWGDRVHLCLPLVWARLGVWLYLLHEATLHLPFALGHFAWDPCFLLPKNIIEITPQKLGLSLSGGGQVTVMSHLPGAFGSLGSSPSLATGQFFLKKGFIPSSF